MMQLGTAKLDITPPVGIDLCGFLARVQPSIGIHDPLSLRALYLQSGPQRLLWLHFDLVGLSHALVTRLQDWARQNLSLDESQLVLSVTHTHSAPATVHLINCGQFDPAYEQRLFEAGCAAATAATQSTQPVRLLAAESQCPLAVDRRKKTFSHVDSRLAVLAFARPDDSLAAVLINYPMHGVALGHTNRLISGDVPGMAAIQLEEQLPHRPLVLFTNGPAGNLDPPKLNDTPAAEAMAAKLADAAKAALGTLTVSSSQDISAASTHVALPLDCLDDAGVDALAARITAPSADQSGYVVDRNRDAVATWRQRMHDRLRNGTAPRTTDLFLQALRLGDVHFVTINAEAFSVLADDLRRRTGKKLYVVAYANHLFGYLAPEPAYADGGYEVETAHVYYDYFRVQKGGLELAAARAAALLLSLPNVPSF